MNISAISAYPMMSSSPARPGTETTHRSRLDRLSSQLSSDRTTSAPTMVQFSKQSSLPNRQHTEKINRRDRGPGRTLQNRTHLVSRTPQAALPSPDVLIHRQAPLVHLIHCHAWPRLLLCNRILSPRLPRPPPPLHTVLEVPHCMPHFRKKISALSAHSRSSFDRSLAGYG